MQLQIEKLEHLKVLNFYVPFKLTKSAILLKPNESENPKFVQNIFGACGGVHCLLTSELLAFRYDETSDAETARLLIMAELEDFFADSEDLHKLNVTNDAFELAQAVADSFIRPTLNRDKGDLELIELDNDVLMVKFTGHCAGCPFAQNTLNNVIIKTFNHYIPQIKEIRLQE